MTDGLVTEGNGETPRTVFYRESLSVWRRWSPWYLRRQLVRLGHNLDDDRGGVCSTDWERTAVERNYRFVCAALDGHDDPAEWCQRYSVKGRTLHIDATRDGKVDV